MSVQPHLRAYRFLDVSDVVALAFDAEEAAELIAKASGKVCDHRRDRYEERRVATAESLNGEVLAPFVEALADIESTCEDFAENGMAEVGRAARRIQSEVATVRRKAEA